MASKNKKFVAFQKDKKLSRAEAMEVGRQLFDAITAEQAANARNAEEDERKRRCRK